LLAEAQPLPGHLAENVLHFGRVLRAAGMPVATDRIELALAALATAGLDEARVAALIRAASTSRDHHEGRAAFAAKREPRFEGR
jgi:uncharacterized protein with von Willebrand factor type A (vWA) domain